MTREDTSTRLKTIMKERNLRQVDILEKAMPLCKKYNVKLNKSDLSQYVAGTVLPGQEKLAILGKALGVSEAWLMGYDVPMDREPKPVKKIKVNISKKDLSEAIRKVMEDSKKNSNGIDWKTICGINDKLFIENVDKLLQDTINKELDNVKESDLEVIEDKNEMLLLKNYRKLNNIGKSEAMKRVEELTCIDKYISYSKNNITKIKEPFPINYAERVAEKAITDYKTLNAAHEIEGASEEDKQHDEDIMNDENF